MDLQTRLNKLKNYRLDLNTFSVYDYNEENIQMLLSRFFTTINETVDVSNKTLDLVSWLVGEGLSLEVAKEINSMFEDGRLSEVINGQIFTDLNNKVNTNKENITTSNTSIENNKTAIEVIDTDLKSLTEYSEREFLSLIDKVGRVLTPEMFGAKGDGIADDTKALNDCFKKYIELKCDVVLQGTYKVSPTRLNEGTNSVCIDITEPTDGKPHINGKNGVIDFQGGGKIFTEYTKETCILRLSTSNVTINNMYLEGIQGTTNLFEIVPYEEKNIDYVGFHCFNSINRAKLVKGKRAITLRGSTYYNDFTDISIVNMTTGITIDETYLQKNNAIRQSAVNRNCFTNITMNVGIINGVDLLYGDTNNFVSCHIEGANRGFLISNVPNDTNSSFFVTESNTLIGCNLEQVKVPLDNKAQGTKVISSQIDVNTCIFTKPPMTFIGGINEHFDPQYVAGLEKTTERSITKGFQKWSSYITSDWGAFAKSSINDYIVESDGSILNLDSKLFDIELSQCSNLTSVSSTLMTSCVGKQVLINGVINLNPTDLNSSITIPLPRGCNSNYQLYFNEFRFMSYMGNAMTPIISIMSSNSIRLIPPTGGFENGKFHISITYSRS